LSTPEREVTSPSDYKVVGALQRPLLLIGPDALRW
jgi:hypothetical protein